MDLDVKSQSKILDLVALRTKVNEALIYNDTKLATEAQIDLEKLLGSSGLEKKFFGELSVMLAQVKFVRFASLTESEMMDLVENYLPICFSIENYDLKTKIGKRILFLGEIELQIGFMEKLVRTFEHCKYWLGSETITLEGKKYEPSLANWIRVYLNQPAKSATRTNIDEWSFIEQGPQAKFLDRDERNILMEVLKIYDSLRNRVFLYRSLPESDNESEVFPNFDLYTYFPGLTMNQQDPNWKEKLGNILDPVIEDGMEGERSEFINQQNLVLPKDFRLPDLPSLSAPGGIPSGPEEAGQKPILPVAWKEAGKGEEGKAQGEGMQVDNLPQKPRPLGTARDLRPVAPVPAKIKFEEPGMGKGLKMWNQEMDQAKPIQPPIPLKPKINPIKSKEQFNGVNIDQKLEELKKKAQKNKNT